MKMDRLRNRGLELRKLAELIRDIRFGVLTTITQDGAFWSRPISTQQATPDGELWFVTKLHSPMANQLERPRRVSLCYAKPVDGSYVSIMGDCELLSDPMKAEELWGPSFQEWLPGGPHDPSLLLVRVRVDSAEYWDAPSATWPLEAGFSVLSPEVRENKAHHAKIDLISEGGPVKVRIGPCPSCHTDHARCYHRNFPTALGIGETPRDAALNLLRRLQRQKDTVADRWHLDTVEAAIAEVQTFLASESSTPRPDDER
jgi:general stress protein 26